ncbi:hypothetical protein [Persephonella sp.]
MHFYVFILFFSVFSYVKAFENINFIFDFSYVGRDKDIYSVDDEHSDFMMNKDKGFNLNYGEVKISYPVEKGVQLKGVFHLTEESFEIGELYFLTGDTFRLKGGKFRSSVGILNEKHQHEWEFSDIPVFYQSFFGYHALTEKGVQVSYNHKYIFTGFEILQGENEYSFGKGKGDLFTFFMKGDLPYIKPVFSYLDGDFREDQSSGRTRMILTGAEISSFKNVRFQGEYAYRIKEDDKSSGYYIQVVYGAEKAVETGFRYGYVENGEYRYSGMITYRFSEHIKLRAQYNYYRSQINEFILELTFETGEDEH